MRIGTRASTLARTQSALIADALTKATGRRTELVLIRTEGDISSKPLATIGGTGVFVSALRDALLRGEIDLAVHSLKDLPTYPADGIALAAVPTREDPRDVVVARDGLTLGELPAGARVGTGSPRRASQLAALGLGVEVVGVRGNIDTRLDKVASGKIDAVVLARAGLARIGRADEATEVLDPLQMLPAPGQGALGLECRADGELRDLVRRALDDPATRACVTAERTLLSELEAGCAAPVGALAEVAEGDLGDELWIRAVALSLDGALSVRRSASGPLDDAVGLGQKVAAEMLAEGAAELISCRNRRSKKAIVTNQNTSSTPASSGARPAKWVSFVGSGPGDPGLLTVRAVELLREAEIVVTEIPDHEQLVRDVLGLSAPVESVGEPAEQPGPVFVDGGFGQDGQPLTHAARAKVIVKQARSGKRVVRLMSGDPFLYASGPEEAQACTKAGVGFEIVPGVSSVSAVPTYAGIPLTTKNHREVAVVNCSDSKVDWSGFPVHQTLVLLSAVGSIGEIAEQLVAAGRSEDTAVSMTSTGTLTCQQTVVSTLGHIGSDVRSAEMAPPAIAVVGPVVDLRETLSWFETKPLFGWRVLVPRTKEQAGGLSSRLRGFGAVPEEVPTISVEPPRNPQQMDKAVRGLVEGRYEWIAFTSVNAVRAVREKFEEYGLDARAFSGLKIAAVGDKTASALADWGLNSDLVPSGEQSARGLLEDWPPYDDVLDPINRVFLPRADIATETLVAGLVDLGWEVDDVTAYRTVRAAPPPAPTREAIKTGRFDAVVFTSSSTVRNLVGIAGKPHASTIIAVIGPATAKTAEEHGLRVDVLAPNPSVEELVDALADFGATRRASMLESGQPVTKPSERRPSTRRRTGSK